MTIALPPEPVQDPTGKPHWLFMKTIPCSIVDDTKNMDEIISSEKPLGEKIIFELRPPSLWKCRKCGAESTFDQGTPTYCPECERNSTFDRITRSINQDLWRLPIWQEITPLDLKKVYEDTRGIIEKLLVFSEPIEYKVYTLWIISTWKLEAWDAVGFPCFIGLANSGKTTALRVIHYLAYRAPKTSGVTSPVIPRLCHYHNITLLLDEAHNKLNPATDTGSSLLDFIKDSYKRDSVYVTCDLNNQEGVISIRNFGFKAFAGERSFNPALLTRSIVFMMSKENPPVAKPSYVEPELNNIQTKLLNYRFMTGIPPDLGNDFVLKGRTREIFESIIRTAIHIGIPYDDIVQYALARDQKEEDELANTAQYDILCTIRTAMENPNPYEDEVKIDLETFLFDLKWESNRENSQKLGYILKDMGLITKRVARTRYLFPNEESNHKRLQLLFRRYLKITDPKQSMLPA